MEYYYCPGLLKLLRYLWVSVAGRAGDVLVFSPIPCQVRLLALPASTVSVFFKKWWWFQGGVALGEGTGACGRAGVLAVVGISGSRAVTSGLGKQNKKNKDSFSEFPGERHFFDLKGYSLF